MSYSDVVEGLHERFATVSALKAVLDYEPNSVQTTPLLYSILDGFERRVEGTVTYTTWRTLHRLLIPYQKPAQVEEDLAGLVMSIIEAVESSPKLGGRLRPGDAQIVSGDADFIEIGDGNWYRRLDFYSQVVEMSRYLGLGG
ncbi:MAG: hypothetical protein PHQ60_15710 [Sideroxydans sp.]|nr:hypothetical protein [Sideroxydans sp.]